MRRGFRVIGTLAAGLTVAWLLAVGAAMAQSTDDAPDTVEPLPEIRDIGQVLAWQQVSEASQPFSVPLGPLNSMGMVDQMAQVEGANSRSWYLRRGPARRLEGAYRRQREMLERAGFEIRSAGFNDDRSGSGTGSANWISLYLALNALPEGAPPVTSDSTQTLGALVASREDAEGTLWAVVVMAQVDERQSGMLVDLVHTLRMSPPEPLSSSALQRAMAMHGHAVLDGVTFTETGALAPGSEAVLSVVSRFLQANTRQVFRLVGHTDERDSLAEAEHVSQTQAEAVVTALVDQYSAARARLRAFGMGPLAPLFPNDTEAGRARNRRVELVAGP